MDQIILASASPRRQDFFRLMKIPFICIPSLIDETPKPGLTPKQIAEDLAIQKALAVAENITQKEFSQRQCSPYPPCLRENSSEENSPKWIFGADTIVVLEGKIFGKPENKADAYQMLKQLASKKHEVITAMALHNMLENKTDCRSVSAEVEFAPLTEKEIKWYLDTGEWEGAAGAYRLQELGACLIKSIKGSPSAVAGLPLHDFYIMLRENGCYFEA